MKLLITGTTGFIGSAFLQSIVKKPTYKVFRLVRSISFESDIRPHFLKWDLGSSSLPEIQETPDVVIHIAGRAHVIGEESVDPLAEFRKVNVNGTLKLAREAARKGAKRFVYISSIGVNGNQNSRPFVVKDPPNPIEPYAISKLEAEENLRYLAEETGMELVVIRPPLVYGPNAPGNFGRLVRLVKNGIPLPLGMVKNKRSLLAVENLVDLIITCIDHPNANGQIFFASDGEDLSTPELIRKLASAMGRPARLLPVPRALLLLLGKIIGKKVEIERLTNSLQVDISHTCDTLGWKPMLSVDEAILKSVLQK